MRRWLAVALAAALLGSAAVALAGGSRQEAHYTLSSHRAHHGTSEHFVFDYRNPNDPKGKPPAVRRVVTVLPRFAHYNTSIPKSCTASDAELMAQGAQACPKNSALGGGVVTVDTGVPGPERIVTADVRFFNNAKDSDGEFIYLNTVRGSGARTVIRADVRHRKTITHAGMLPGTPPDGGAIDTVDLTVKAVHTSAGNYITTPRRCPARGYWRTRVHFTYADGVTQTVPDRTRCQR
jgi:hypothetical protein